MDEKEMTVQEQDLHCLRPNTKLNDRYMIKSVLGEGGFGITYLARDELFDEEVAIKEFFPQGIVTRNYEFGNDVTVTYVKQKKDYDNGRRRFLSEAKVMAKFNKNPGIVSVIDFFQANNTAYIVMKYLEGINLKDYLRQNGSLAADEILELMSPVIEALDAVHSNGLIHRDISPDNIMLLTDGGVKLMDFGAARDYTEFGNKSLSVVLKHGYAPPEQYQSHGVQGPWTDIYALSATIYKCLTGLAPEDSIERMMDDQLLPPSKLGVAVPKYMEQAIMKGMKLSPKDRYQNIRDFCDDFYRDYRDYKEGLAEEKPEEQTEERTEAEKNVEQKLEQPEQKLEQREPEPAQPEIKEKKTGLGKKKKIAIIIIAAIAVCAAVYIFIQTGNRDLKDGIFKLDGKTYQLPFDYEELTDAGWEIQYYEGDGWVYENGEYKLRNGCAQGVEMELQGKTIEITLDNGEGNEPEPVNQCKVRAITVSTIDGREAPKFSIAKGITLDFSEKEIRKAFGEPSEVTEGEYDDTRNASKLWYLFNGSSVIFTIINDNEKEIYMTGQ